jgi:hypothetical protein
MIVGVALTLSAASALSTPVPVDVRGTIGVGVERDNLALLIQVALVLATAGLAVFTAFLFASTREVARTTGEVAADTLAAADLADRHHQETMRPALVVTVAWLAAGTPGRATLHLEGQNIGLGPAFNVVANVTSGELGDLHQFFGHVGAGNMFTFESHEVRVGIPLERTPVGRLRFDLELAYWNLFEKQAASRCVVDVNLVGVITFRPPDIVQRPRVASSPTK